MKPIEWRQLCAVTREQFDPADPTFTDAEWSERIKRRIVALRRQYPPPHTITAAMRAVERAMSRQGIHRAPATPPRPPGNGPREDAPISHPEAAAILAGLHAKGLIKPMPKVRAMSPRAADCHKAARMIAQAIVWQVERCEAAEQTAAAAAAAVELEAK
jgi:hypothetical protein